MADALSVERAAFEEKFKTTVDKGEAENILKTLRELGGELKISDIKAFAGGEDVAGRNLGPKPGAGKGRQPKAITATTGNRADQIVAVALYIASGLVEGSELKKLVLSNLVAPLEKRILDKLPKPPALDPTAVEDVACLYCGHKNVRHLAGKTKKDVEETNEKLLAEYRTQLELDALLPFVQRGKLKPPKFERVVYVCGCAVTTCANCPGNTGSEAHCDDSTDIEGAGRSCHCT